MCHLNGHNNVITLNVLMEYLNECILGLSFIQLIGNNDSEHTMNLLMRTNIENMSDIHSATTFIMNYALCLRKENFKR